MVCLLFFHHFTIWVKRPNADPTKKKKGWTSLFFKATEIENTIHLISTSTSSNSWSSKENILSWVVPVPVSWQRYTSDLVEWLKTWTPLFWDNSEWVIAVGCEIFTGYNKLKLSLVYKIQLTKKIVFLYFFFCVFLTFVTSLHAMQNGLLVKTHCTLE